MKQTSATVRSMSCSVTACPGCPSTWVRVRVRVRGRGRGRGWGWGRGRGRGRGRGLR